MTGWSITLRAARTRNYTVSCAQVSFLIVLSMMTACQSAPPPEKKNTVELTLIAGLNMNPNRRGVASPLKVTVYALNDDEAFLDAGFLTITESPDPELKKEMQQLWEGILRPGEKKQVTVVTDDTAHALGIVAAYLPCPVRRLTALLVCLTINTRCLSCMTTPCKPAIR
ncbi:type VI secretion system lipoprotein TssJ [Cronobacter sakazakii]|nr:type VI secretion system lipoprotein TssJ [Cronobacter sakazakii]ELY4312854.1 type VI secretion system lipoprotein TssJ [Cronobacter sakazakii]HAU5487809.1 type VI secretion system lipoprotein TssJ [Cronobacter sakazakii]